MVFGRKTFNIFNRLFNILNVEKNPAHIIQVFSKKVLFLGMGKNGEFA
ncbi:MAG: hypothetical protein PWQ76_307 [Clostridiales bacterium]|jgi:hypothetical protein|nr:hypothetical protein [Oscillospiraceae bacterium]MDN5378054.1 hypothetical protein [Clostridiales bacterium]